MIDELTGLSTEPNEVAATNPRAKPISSGVGLRARVPPGSTASRVIVRLFQAGSPGRATAMASTMPCRAARRKIAFSLVLPGPVWKDLDRRGAWEEGHSTLPRHLV